MRIHDRNDDSRERGFGLLEMTIAAAVLGLMMAGAFTMLFRSQVTFELQLANMEIRQQARVALDRMSTELRLAGYRIDNLPDALTRGGANVIQFVGDIDDSDAGPPCGAAFETAANGGAERIQYQLQTGELLRTLDCWDGSAWSNEFSNQVVTDNLVGAQTIFRYFDEDGAELIPAGAELTAAQLADVRLVTIDLAMLDSENPVEGNNPEFDLGARVRLPNVQ